MTERSTEAPSEDRSRAVAAATSAADPTRYAALPHGPYQVIAADPNWQYKPWSVQKNPRDNRAPERHYRTDTIETIASLPVAQIGSRDCHLFLWITGPMLVQGVHGRILDAWGFKPSGIAYVWVKVNRKSLTGRFFRPVSEKDFFMGLGKTTRQNAEFVVLGRRGNPPRVDKGNHQIIVAPRREHSRKPEEFFHRVEKYAGDVPRLELFARKSRPGWDTWGDQAGMFDDE